MRVGPIRIAHVIPDLAIGGAERALVRLLESLDRTSFVSLVVTLRGGGALVEHAERTGARVVSLDMRRRMPSPRAVLRLRAALRAFAPDVVQGWMYHGNIAAWFGARLLDPRPAVAWNIRQSLASLVHERPVTRLAIRANALLSSRVERIVNNSRASAVQHAALGFDASRVVVVPNGVDTALFRPDPVARIALRTKLGLRSDTFLVGMIARAHPVKRHDLFLAAVAAAVSSGLDVHALLVGRGTAPASTKITQFVATAGLTGRVHLLGERTDIELVLPGLDVLVSASGWAEGFPNAIAEAMACGVPCVVTDTGDCADLLGAAGAVVPPGDGAALAAALVELLRLPAEQRSALGRVGRERVASQFSLAQSAACYAALYEELTRPERRASFAGAAAAATQEPRRPPGKRPHRGATR